MFLWPYLHQFGQNESGPCTLTWHFYNLNKSGKWLQIFHHFTGLSMAHVLVMIKFAEVGCPSEHQEVDLHWGIAVALNQCHSSGAKQRDVLSYNHWSVVESLGADD